MNEMKKKKRVDYPSASSRVTSNVINCIGSSVLFSTAFQKFVDTLRVDIRMIETQCAHSETNLAESVVLAILELEWSERFSAKNSAQSEKSQV